MPDAVVGLVQAVQAVCGGAPGDPLNLLVCVWRLVSVAERAFAFSWCPRCDESQLCWHCARDHCGRGRSRSRTPPPAVAPPVPEPEPDAAV